MILFLHNRYRVQGGEERAVADLAWLVREQLGEGVELLERDSLAASAPAAARDLLRGGSAPGEVAAAVRRTGARIVHAHNLNPAFGPRALAAARAEGAKVVLHLHNYRLVCAVGTCVDPRGEDCVRCHARDTRPGVRLNCRGSRPEALVYATALAGHSAALTGHADAIVVPSRAAHDRLRALDAPLGDTPVHVVGHVVRELGLATPEVSSRSTSAPQPASPPSPLSTPHGYALVVARLAREKAVDVAIEACRRASVPLVIAGDGPERARLERAAAGADVRFTGRVGPTELAALRADAGVAVVTTRAHETFGLAALEAMAAGLPTVVIARGALTELAEGVELVATLEPAELAAAILRVRGDAAAGRRAHAAARRRAAPAVVAAALQAVYRSVGTAGPVA